MMRAEGIPAIVTFSSLFPSSAQPFAGIFIRERMFRVGRVLPLSVVAPSPWFPGDALIRRFRPTYRIRYPLHERQEGHDVWRPCFLSLPSAAKHFDGRSMALGAMPTLRRLRSSGRLDILDAHFGYPDGYAAVLAGRWLRVPVTITLRGTELRHGRIPALRRRLTWALNGASRVFAVSESLRQIALSLGTPPERVRVVGNGVDLTKFRAVDKQEARRSLGLPIDAKVIISVGGLVERKGFHRVLDCMPALLQRFPRLVYLIVGGPSAEGDWSQRLAHQSERLGLGRHVRFLGALPSSELPLPLSAADVFVLATTNEGWANVFLEAMACELPVVTTSVGGNAEVVSDSSLGVIVPPDDPDRLTGTLCEALEREWDRGAIRRYAERNSWDGRIAVLVEEFRAIANAVRSVRTGSSHGSTPPDGVTSIE
jgi:glycosyltransferase involved in cell wall biosynthesis